MSVVVQLRGGLGNQLFQYAAGVALARRHGEPIVLDTALLPPSEVSRGGVRRWTEQLSGFAHEGTFIDSTGDSPARKRVAQSLAGRERAIGDSRIAGVLGPRVYAREQFDDLAAFSALPPGSRINAYCNSPRFFAEIEAEIRSQVASLVAPGSWYLDELERIRRDAPIAVHLRWGDYLNLAHVYGAVPADYYRRSLELLQREVGDRPVWLFSDDTAGASEFLRGTVDIARVIEPPAESTPLENLLLLGSSRAIVCANSSFSWWAAFLAESGPGSIVFPRPLFAESGPAEPKNWLLADWMQLGRE